MSTPMRTSEDDRNSKSTVDYGLTSSPWKKPMKDPMKSFEAKMKRERKNNDSE